MSSGTQLGERERRPRRRPSAARPATRTRRRPNRSAWVVSHSEITCRRRASASGRARSSAASRPERVEVEDEDDREEPVAEHPQRPHREQEAAVAVEPAQARDESRVGCSAGRQRIGPSLRGATAPGTGLRECRRRSEPTMSADAHAERRTRPRRSGRASPDRRPRRRPRARRPRPRRGAARPDRRRGVGRRRRSVSCSGSSSRPASRSRRRLRLTRGRRRRSG